MAWVGGFVCIFSVGVWAIVMGWVECVYEYLCTRITPRLMGWKSNERQRKLGREDGRYSARLGLREYNVCTRATNQDEDARHITTILDESMSNPCGLPLRS